MIESCSHPSITQIELDINPDDQVWVHLSCGVCLTTLQITRIKEKVEEQSGVPPAQQRLIFGGRQMYVLTHFRSLAVPLTGSYQAG